MKSHDAAKSKNNSGITAKNHAWSPEDAAGYIRFQLAELGGRNGHHEFENLCRHLARCRIYPNIIPATGPVSAGGDQGADFETFTVNPQNISQFFARASREKVIFACSLEKDYKGKIKKDLKAICRFHTRIKTLICFHAQQIPTSVRHEMQRFARDQFGIKLEIFDSFAISELLADGDTLWIGKRFLNIPNDVTLKKPSRRDTWYDEVAKRNLPIQIRNRILSIAQKTTLYRRNYVLHFAVTRSRTGVRVDADYEFELFNSMRTKQPYLQELTIDDNENGSVHGMSILVEGGQGSYNLIKPPPSEKLRGYSAFRGPKLLVEPNTRGFVYICRASWVVHRNRTDMWYNHMALPTIGMMVETKASSEFDITPSFSSNRLIMAAEHIDIAWHLRTDGGR